MSVKYAVHEKHELYIQGHMSSKYFKDDLKDEIESDDVTERGSEFPTEQVFGTKYDKMADIKDD